METSKLFLEPCAVAAKAIGRILANKQKLIRVLKALKSFNVDGEDVFKAAVEERVSAFRS